MSPVNRSSQPARPPVPAGRASAICTADNTADSTAFNPAGTRDWQRRRLLLVSVCAVVCAACGSLTPASPAPSVYLLEGTAPRQAVSAGTTGTTGTRRATDRTVVLAAIQSAAGFDTNRMAYTRGRHQLDWFAHNEWADSPARMLDSVLLRALQDGQSQFAVVPDAGSASTSGSARLELQLLQVVQDFSSRPSQLRLSLRATLVNSADNRVLAWRAFDLQEAAASEDAAGGVAAANRAVQALAGELTRWCTQALAP